MSNFDKYKAGFDVELGHRILTEIWCFEEKLSNENKLVFYGYDANFFPLPNLSERNDKSNQMRVEHAKEKALELTKGFNGEVWLDDVKIKEAYENENK